MADRCCDFPWHPLDSLPPIAYSKHPWPAKVLFGLPPDVLWPCNPPLPRSYISQPSHFVLLRLPSIPHHLLVTRSWMWYCSRVSLFCSGFSGKFSTSLDTPGGAVVRGGVCVTQVGKHPAGMGVVIEGAASPQSRHLRYDAQVRLAASTVSLPGFVDPRMEDKSPWNPANLLFTTDYDCTCTVEDSCELLVWAKEDALNISDRRLMKAYEALLDEYEVILKDHIAAMPELEENGNASLVPSTSYAGELGVDLLLKLGLDPRLVSQIRSCVESPLLHEPAKFLRGDYHFDTRQLRKALKHLAGLETVMNGKVMAAGFLKGLRREAIRAAGKRVVLQHHCLDVLARLTALGTSIHVISANWSRDLIYGGLSHLPEERLFVHCNDLDFDRNGEATGLFQNQVINALDKESVQQALRTITRQGPYDKRMVVYLGDAQTDLLALLDADLGVVIGKRAALRNLLEQYSIQLRPLVEAAALLATGQVSTFRQSGFLFYATGWEDVETCLLQHDQIASETTVEAHLSVMPLARAIKIAA